MSNETKTSYSGCHPVIAESLRRGEHIECRVWDSEDDTLYPMTVISYREGDVCPYITDDIDGYRKAEPLPKTETRVKQPVALMQALIDAGYEVDVDGHWAKDDHRSFFPDRWFYCGEKPNTLWHWLPEWLEEVEIEDRN